LIFVEKWFPRAYVEAWDRHRRCRHCIRHVDRQ